MTKAPKDGTIILVCETPNGEVWNVLPAAFMNLYGEGRPEWWGVDTTSRLPLHLSTPERSASADMHRPLGVDWRPIALTPVCWQPMPGMEDIATLSRRHSAILAHKYRVREQVVQSQALEPGAG